MNKNTTINIGGIGTAIIIVGLFWIAYAIDKENKEFCVASEGKVVVYDRDIIFDDWTCN